jgi:hypothetical protein
MKCSYCGRENAEAATHCHECGSDLQLEPRSKPDGISGVFAGNPKAKRYWKLAAGSLCIISVVSLLIAIQIAARLYSRGMWKAVLAAEGAQLRGLHSEWKRVKSSPTGDVSALLRPMGSFKPMIFTNTVVVNGKTYVCALGSDSAVFAGRGILVISTNDVLIWLNHGEGPTLVE